MYTKPKSCLLLSALFIWAGLTAPVLKAAEPADRAPLEEMAALLDAMQLEAQRLEDILAIGRLQRAYGYYIDKGYWHEAADLFSSSATLEVGMDGVYLGKDRVREMLVRYGNGHAGTGPGLAFGIMNRHFQLQPVINIGADGRTAQARWRNFSLLGEYLKGAWWGDSILENTYRKENGVWKIQSLHLYPVFVAPYRAGWADLAPAAEDWRSQAARNHPADAMTDLGYRPFPEQYPIPFHWPRPAQRSARVAWESRLGSWGDGEGEFGALELRLRDFGRKLDNLAAEREIENLQAMYGYYLDKGQWDDAAALFSENASFESGQSGVYVGRARIRNALALTGPTGLEYGMLNNQLMLQPVITVAPDNLTARARWHSDVQSARAGRGLRGGGVYENEYINENGLWKISRLHYYVTYQMDQARGWHEGLLPLDPPSQALPPDLPATEIYGAQPDVHTIPYHYPHPVTGTPSIGTGDPS